MINKIIQRAMDKVRIELQGLKMFFSKKNFILIGTEDFGNFGDHHIAESEIEFLKSYFPEYRITEVCASEYGWKIKQIERYVRKRDIIFLTGGGNMGDQYLKSSRIRREVFNKFPDNQIFIFPQTIYYSDLNGEEFRMDQEEMAKPKHLHLFTREKYSYEFAKKHFSMDVSLFPDIVLFSKYDSEKYKRSGVLLCIRSDIESKLQEQDKKYIADICGKYFKQKSHTDTQYEENIPVKNRRSELDAKLDEFRKASMVVTDRLHGMVFSTITGTPCIVLPNYNQKVKGVYQWLKNVNYVTFIENLDELEDKILELQNVKVDMTFEFTPEFNKMRDKIKKEIGEA